MKAGKMHHRAALLGGVLAFVVAGASGCSGARAGAAEPEILVYKSPT